MSEFEKRMDMIQRENCNGCRRKEIGMTLIEIMIVVVLIGVLASIAYPTFTHHVRQAHRQTVKADMLKIQLLLEQGYHNGQYSQTGIVSGSTCLVCDTDARRYEIDVSISGSQYNVTATAQSDLGQVNDRCQDVQYLSLTLNQAGQAAPAECW